MTTDQEKWNLRYKQKAGNLQPSKILEDYCKFTHSGKALDLACGNGRNSLFLAQKGFTVDAVDISNIAIDQLGGQHPNINPVCTDLKNWKIPEKNYTLIANIRYLERELFPGIIHGLTSGGILLFESFIGQKNEPFCLMENELLIAFQSFRIIFYKEQENDASSRFDHTVTMVAIKK